MGTEELRENRELCGTVSVKLGSEYGPPAVSAFTELAMFQKNSFNIILHIIVLLESEKPRKMER